MFSMTWGWANNWDASDLKPDRAHYGVTLIMQTLRNCPSQMNENLLINDSKFGGANQQIWAYLWGTVMVGVY